METIIVEIYFPTINQKHDFVLPAHIPIGSILQELIIAVEDSAKNLLIDNKHPVLCDMISRRPLALEQTLSQAGIRDSHQLMLL